MSSGHDNHDNHSNEPKTISFRTPMILALVTVLAIVLLVNACDKKNECCEDGTKCEEKAGEHGGHENTMHEEHTEKQEGSTLVNPAEENHVTDSLAMPPADTAHVKAPEHTAH